MLFININYSFSYIVNLVYSLNKNSSSYLIKAVKAIKKKLKLLNSLLTNSIKIVITIINLYIKKEYIIKKYKYYKK